MALDLDLPLQETRPPLGEPEKVVRTRDVSHCWCDLDPSETDR